MPKGGAMPGAGRPAKKDKYAGAISRSERYIADRLPSLIDNMFVLANGVTVQEVNQLTGELVVYKKPPDRKANEYLINRIMGLPRARIETSGAIRVDVTKLSDDELRAIIED